MSPDESTVYLSDEQRLLSLFAQGMGGRYFHLRTADLMPGRFRVADLDVPTSDGNALYLPNDFNLFDVPVDNLGAYKVTILHQLGYFEFGTFLFNMAEARNRIPDLPSEMGDHVPGEVPFETFFSLFRAPILAKRLFAIVEDFRIDQCIYRAWPGIRLDLARVMVHALSGRRHFDTFNGPAGLMEGLVRHSLGAAEDDLLERDQTGLMPLVLEALEPLSTDDADVYHSAIALTAVYEVMLAAGYGMTMPAEGLSLKEASDLSLDLFASSGNTEEILDETLLETENVDFRGEMRPELAQKRLQLERLKSEIDRLKDGGMEMPAETLAALMASEGLRVSDGGEGSAEGDEEALFITMLEGQEPLRKQTLEKAEELLGQQVRSHETDLRREFGDLSRASRSYLYDEWDYLGRQYLKGWCRLFERSFEDHEYGALEDVRGDLRSLLSQVRKQFQFLKTESYERVRKVNDGEELDIDAAIEARVDIRAGQSPDERIYSRNEKRRRDVAAAFLIDLSASTSEPVPTNDEENEALDPEDDNIRNFMTAFNTAPASATEEDSVRRIIDVEKEAAILMCDALEQMGDAYAIYGFSGYGRDEVEFYTAKDFDQRLTNKVWEGIAAMKPNRSTRMGTAIRHCLTKLERQEARLKILMIISDGYPQDMDYGPERGNREYGIEDTAKALEEAARAGVQTFCVTVDQAGHDYLRRMCPDERYLVIEDIDALPAELARTYRTLTG